MPLTLLADADEVQWEKKLETYFQHHKTPYLTRLRFYTYLYAAQNDAATCPTSVLNSVTALLTQRFFADFVDFPAFDYDRHSERLAKDILCPYFARLSLEDAGKKKFHYCSWSKTIPISVQQVANWIPWIPLLPQPQPPLAQKDEQGWIQQFEQLKQIRQSLTEQQKTLVEKWAGHHGKSYEWRLMALHYMQDCQVPLGKLLYVRSLLMKALYDGQIAELCAKYTFCIPRPYMTHPSFKPLITPLQTPSYPSGHAIAGAIFSGILSHFFPEERTLWEGYMHEGSCTRLWAGVHYPEDIQQGELLGQKIVTLTLENSEQHFDVHQEQAHVAFQTLQSETYDLLAPLHAHHALQ